MENPRISDISISSFSIRPEYVKYLIRVQGRTRFLHPLSTYGALPEFHKSTRYSKLLSFHHSLSRRFPELLLPPFPPKKWIHNKSQAFIRGRIAKLNNYLSQVLQFPQVQSSLQVLDLVTPRRTLSIGVIGGLSVEPDKIASLFVNPFCSENTIISRSSKKMLEQHVNTNPIDLVVQNRIKRIESISVAYYSEEEVRNFVRAVCKGLAGVAVVYNSEEEASKEVALAIERVLSGVVPCVVCQKGFSGGQYGQINNAQQTFEAFKRLVELVK